jgi:hypothetical protein
VRTSRKPSERLRRRVRRIVHDYRARRVGGHGDGYLSYRECEVHLIVSFIQLDYLVVWINYPLGCVCACLSCERAYVPDLGLAWSDSVWAASPILTVIVHVKVVARRSHGSEILQGRNDEELVARVHLRDRLTRGGAFLEPNVINR